MSPEKVKECAILGAFYIRQGWIQTGYAITRYKWLLDECMDGPRSAERLELYRYLFWKELDPMYQRDVNRPNRDR